MVQAPQDHRDGERSVMHHAATANMPVSSTSAWSSATRANAIIVHGTMCLIRRAALLSAGGWSSDTIVEDSDLGLTVLEHGWQIHYTNRRYGHGLLPDTFEAFRSSAIAGLMAACGSCASIGAHLLPRADGLAREQKREFALGWLNWLGAEAIGVVVAILNLVWVPVVAFAGIAIPDKVLTIPILAAFGGARPLRCALSPAGRGPARTDDRRGRRRHVGAVDGRAGSRLRRVEGEPSLHAHRQGRATSKGRTSRRSGKRCSRRCC